MLACRTITRLCWTGWSLPPSAPTRGLGTYVLTVLVFYLTLNKQPLHVPHFFLLPPHLGRYSPPLDCPALTSLPPMTTPVWALPLTLTPHLGRWLPPLGCPTLTSIPPMATPTWAHPPLLASPLGRGLYL